MFVERFLKKFIDFSLMLDFGSVNEQYREKYPFYFERFIINDADETILNKVFPKLLKKINIRRIEKLIEKVNIIHSVICNDKVDISVFGMFKTFC